MGRGLFEKVHNQFLPLRRRRCCTGHSNAALSSSRCREFPMRLLLVLVFACAVSQAVATRCKVGISNSCAEQLLPLNQSSFACYTCDNGLFVEAGSCSQNFYEPTAMCSDLQLKCEAHGGVFTWCYGDSCNSCSPRYQPLPLETWANKSVAFVTAHPDDLEALAGATVAALTKQVR
jgi:hypothetical protein